MKKYETVTAYIEGQDYFKEELSELRVLLLKTELEESMKWGMPTYCIQNKNILGMAAFKHHFCIWFHQGALINDKHNLLINAQEGKTRAMRQMRFTQKSEINAQILSSYVSQAIQNHKNGKEVKVNRAPKPVVIPKELSAELENEADLKKAFFQLSPFKQREYCEYISTAKRATTKTSRLEKIIPMIIEGKGLNDKYKNC